MCFSSRVPRKDLLEQRADILPRRSTTPPAPRARCRPASGNPAAPPAAPALLQPQQPPREILERALQKALQRRRRDPRRPLLAGTRARAPAHDPPARLHLVLPAAPAAPAAPSPPAAQSSPETARADCDRPRASNSGQRERHGAWSRASPPNRTAPAPPARTAPPCAPGRRSRSSDRRAASGKKGSCR